MANRGRDQSGAVSLTRGALFGRYVVIGELGTGGMGVVYAAYDPQLDRKVAIKVLTARKAASQSAKVRLLREARALAKLSHPNVVQIHDVGEHDGHVFLAMEFIDGQSLQHFCQTTPRPSWHAVLKVYIDAARGLAAAHEKGLIHRDFKPANVLIGQDGRVRVADFGLVVDQDTMSGISEPANVLASHSGAHSDRITIVGALMGTPAYMAPEQHHTADVGPLADQYSFCASLYEGLYGRPPFQRAGANKRSETPSALLRRKLNDPVTRPGDDTSDVPAWLHAIIARGLAPKLEDRFSSMDALIAALLSDPVAKRRTRLQKSALAAAMGTTLCLAALGWIDRGTEVENTVCSTVPAMLAGVWDSDRREAVAAGFTATGAPLAESTYKRLDAALTHYAEDWTRISTEACEATWVHKRQSEHVLDLRTFCLDQRLGRLAALTRFLASGIDAEVIDNAIQATLSLPSLADCSDIEALTLVAPPPKDPGERARISELQARLDEVRSLFTAGKFSLAHERAEALLDKSIRLDYAPLRAQIMYTAGDLRKIQGRPDDAVSLLRDGLAVAARAGDDAVAAEMWALLLELIGIDQASVDLFRELLPYAEVAFERTKDELARAHFLRKKGLVIWNIGQNEEALAILQRALALCMSAAGAESYAVADALNNLGLVYKELERFEEARAHFERSLAITTRLLGEEHPEVAPLYNNIANAFLDLGRLSEARAMHERALAIRERAYGSNHREVAQSQGNLAIVLHRSGDYPAAKAAYERALAINRSIVSGTHPDVAQNLSNLGTLLTTTAEHVHAKAVLEESLEIMSAVYGERSSHTALVRAKLAPILSYLGRQREAQAQVEAALALSKDLPAGGKASVLVSAGAVHFHGGRPDLARSYQEQALALQESALGPQHIAISYASAALARTLIKLGQYEAARAAAERARSVHAHTFPPEHPDLALPLLALGELELALGQPEQALPHLQAAAALTEEVGHYILADSYRLQAEALWATGRERERARDLAKRALDRYRASGREPMAGKMAAWLRQH